MASQAKEWASRLDLVGGIIALLTGILLLIGIIDLDVVVGIILLVVGILAIVKST